jgi:hypothetical protein
MRRLMLIPLLAFGLTLGLAVPPSAHAGHSPRCHDVYVDELGAEQVKLRNVGCKPARRELGRILRYINNFNPLPEPPWQVHGWRVAYIKGHGRFVAHRGGKRISFLLASLF